MKIIIVHEIPEHVLDRFQQILARIERKVNAIMATQAEVLQLLSDANDETNAIGVELQTLLDRDEVPQSVKDSAQALVDRLKAVAAEAPTIPAEPPTT